MLLTGVVTRCEYLLAIKGVFWPGDFRQQADDGGLEPLLFRQTLMSSCVDDLLTPSLRTILLPNGSPDPWVGITLFQALGRPPASPPTFPNHPGGSSRFSDHNGAEGAYPITTLDTNPVHSFQIWGGDVFEE